MDRSRSPGVMAIRRRNGQASADSNTNEAKTMTQIGETWSAAARRRSARTSPPRIHPDGPFPCRRLPQGWRKSL